MNNNPPPAFRDRSVGFEDAECRTITTFTLMRDGWLNISMRNSNGSGPYGHCEVHYDDLIDCLQELKRRTEEDGWED